LGRLPLDEAGVHLIEVERAKLFDGDGLVVELALFSRIVSLRHATKWTFASCLALSAVTRGIKAICTGWDCRKWLIGGI
jgi:hypothetical protein